MSTPMQKSGYQSQSRLSPTAIAGVLFVHAALGTVILSMSAVKIIDLPEIPIWVRNIPKDPPRPTVDPIPPKVPVDTRDRPVTTTIPTIDLPQSPEKGLALPPLTPDLDSYGDTGQAENPVRPVDPPPPVLVEARPDTRFATGFQPPYPAAMLRQQKEGAVTVRLTIGPDGRVQEVALVSAADPAFYEATRRQALSRWRFVPATRDGVAILSQRVMVVHFRLTD